MTDRVAKTAMHKACTMRAQAVHTRRVWALTLALAGTAVAAPANAQAIPADWAALRIQNDYALCRDIILNANPVQVPEAVASLQTGRGGASLRIDVTLNTASEGGTGTVDYRYYGDGGLQIRCEIFAPLAAETAAETRILVEAGYADLIAAPNLMNHDVNEGSFLGFTCVDPVQAGAPQTIMQASIIESTNRDDVNGFLIEVEGFYNPEALACSEQ